MASAFQDRQSHTGDHLVPLLEGQQAIMDHFDNLLGKNDTLANELENINSAISRQHQDLAQHLPSSADEDREALEMKQSEVDDLRNQLHQVQLEREREKIEAEQAVRQLTEAKDRVQSLETSLERVELQQREKTEDCNRLEEDRRRMGENHERVQSELEELRRESNDQAVLRESLRGLQTIKQND